MSGKWAKHITQAQQEEHAKKRLCHIHDVPVADCFTEHYPQSVRHHDDIVVLATDDVFREASQLMNEFEPHGEQCACSLCNKRSLNFDSYNPEE
jgi:hypothetical protein